MKKGVVSGVRYPTTMRASWGVIAATMVAGTEAFMGGSPSMLAPSASLSAKAAMVGPSSRKAPACLALRMQDNDGVSNIS